MPFWNAILGGCSNDVLPQVRSELVSHSIPIAAEVAKLDELCTSQMRDGNERHLFIVQLKAAGDVDQLRRLSRVHVGQPIIALVAKEAASSFLLGVMRAGATQVVSLPVESQDFAAAVELITLHHAGPTAARGRVIAVSRVNGGCGGTTIALNLAYELAHRYNEPSILAELSVQLGMLVTYLDVQPRYTLGDLLMYGNNLDVQAVASALTPISDRFKILAGPAQTVSHQSDPHTTILRVMHYLRFLSNMVVVDVPCTFDDDYFELLGHADQVVLVAEQRIPSIRNIQLVLEALGGDSARNCFLVLNRYDPCVTGFTLKELEKLMRLPRAFTVRDDRAVRSALDNGRALRMQSEKSGVLDDLEVLVQALLGIEKRPTAASASPNFFNRFCQAIGFSAARS